MKRLKLFIIEGEKRPRKNVSHTPHPGGVDKKKDIFLWNRFSNSKIKFLLRTSFSYDAYFLKYFYVLT